MDYLDKLKRPTKDVNGHREWLVRRGWERVEYCNLTARELLLHSSLGN